MNERKNVKVLCSVSAVEEFRRMGFVNDARQRTKSLTWLTHPCPNHALTAALLDKGRDGLPFWSEFSALDGQLSMRVISDGRLCIAFTTADDDEDPAIFIGRNGSFRGFPVTLERWAATALLGGFPEQKAITGTRET